MIIHKRLIVQRYGKEKDDRYLCNQACGVTKEKLTDIWDCVTCKNCLLIKLKDDNEKQNL